jgi:trimeric autotransporter adhesin
VSAAATTATTATTVTDLQISTDTSDSQNKISASMPITVTDSLNSSNGSSSSSSSSAGSSIKGSSNSSSRHDLGHSDGKRKSDSVTPAVAVHTAATGAEEAGTMMHSQDQPVTSSTLPQAPSESTCSATSTASTDSIKQADTTASAATAVQRAPATATATVTASATSAAQAKVEHGKFAKLILATASAATVPTTTLTVTQRVSTSGSSPYVTSVQLQSLLEEFAGMLNSNGALGTKAIATVTEATMALTLTFTVQLATVTSSSSTAITPLQYLQLSDALESAVIANGAMVTGTTLATNE